MSCERGGRSDAADFSRPSVNQSVSQLLHMRCSASYLPRPVATGSTWCTSFFFPFSVRVFSCPPRAPLSLCLSVKCTPSSRARKPPFPCPQKLVFFTLTLRLLFCLFVFFGFCRKSVSSAGVKEEGWRTFLSPSLFLSLSLCDTVWDRNCVPSFFFSFFISSFLGGVFFLYNHIHIQIPPWSPIVLLSCNHIEINTHLRSSFTSVSNSCSSLYTHIHIQIPPWSPILLLSCNQHPSVIQFPIRLQFLFFSLHSHSHLVFTIVSNSASVLQSTPI